MLPPVFGRETMRFVVLSLAALALGSCATPVKPEAATPTISSAGEAQQFSVVLAPGAESASGRLIAIATPVAAVRASPALPHPPVINPGEGSYVAAQEAPLVTPTQPVRFDADLLADP